VKKLQELRKLNGYKGKDVALILGISIRTYESYEQGKRKPKIEKLKQMAKLFKCTIDDLV